MGNGIADCAELHNEIVRQSWHVTSAPFVPFWERYSECQGQILNSLGADVVEFYKRALVPARSVSAEDPYQNFFYYFQGLALPWDDMQASDKSLGRDIRFISLYLAPKSSGTQQGGIILDQETGRASVQTDLSSVHTASTSVVWQPLSTILHTCIALIDIGKITAAKSKSALESIRPGENGPPHPWEYHSYSQGILSRTLAAYHDLIAAIEAAREMDEHQDHELTVYLSTHFNLDAASFPKECFARSFLTAARRPRGPRRVRFIAPGIELPSAMTIRDQPFRAVAKKNRCASGVQGILSVDHEEGSDPLYPPFLLFPGQGTKPKSEGNRAAVFAAPFDGLDECPVGLWLDRAEPWSGQGGEDEAVLVPFEQHSRVSSSLFEAGTRMPLFTVLEQWTELVRIGAWQVDERGVMGGIELLRQESCPFRELRGRSRFRDTSK